MATTISLTIVVSALLACSLLLILQGPVNNLRYLIRRKLAIHKKMRQIAMGQMPGFTGISFSKKQIIKIKKLLPKNSTHQQYYENYIKCRYSGDLSELP